MPVSETSVIAILFFAGAALYASVGHAGASAYLAVMGLFNFAPERDEADGARAQHSRCRCRDVKFYRAGPVLVVAFLAVRDRVDSGGIYRRRDDVARSLVPQSSLESCSSTRRCGCSAPRSSRCGPTRTRHRCGLRLIAGLAIGFLSGLTGVGGGIFLSPLLLYMGWAETRATSGVAAPFILVNSIAGLLGHFSSVAQLPPNIPRLGSRGGDRRLDRSDLWKPARAGAGAAAASVAGARRRRGQAGGRLLITCA